VLGNGPVPCRIFGLGEAPGRDEDREGIPFIGQAGREFNENYLQLAGLNRKDVYITNTRKCRPDLNRKPTFKEAFDCASHHLPQELADVSPEIVILMGATACSLVPDIDLEVEHGIPRHGSLFGWEGYMVPMYHPAAGLHDTGMMVPLLEDWEGLREWLRSGVWGWPVDSVSRDYALLQSRSDLFNYIGLTRLPDLMGVDTESHGGVPWSLQFSLQPGSARMVLLQDSVIKVVVEFLRQVIYNNHTEFVLHNAPADLPILYSLGIQGFRWRDTMQESYHLGNLPQGLKALSYRLLGRRRKSWEETVTGPSKDALCSWIMDAIMHTEDHWRSVIERTGKRGQKLRPIITPSDTEQTLRSILKHAGSSESYDVWVKLRERMGPMPEIEGVLGPVPVKGIAHVPLERAIEYGCSDADDTLAVALVLERLRKEMAGKMDVQEEDYDQVR
jgi:DNA polymerase